MNPDIRLQRWFEAPPDVVFDAYTDPDAQRAIRAGGADWVVESECDLRVGGEWIIRFGPSSMSLDGFITGPNAGVGNGMGDDGDRLHDWRFDAKTETDAAIVTTCMSRPGRS